ncbi:YfzA family protein [Paenibacillus xylanilyticus]|uniref:YfzA family protein n=1 Tax=Paenibacillus xylanilyticus TaxID=248903 RepID=UPI0039A33F35
MKNSQKKGFSFLSKGWVLTLGGFIILQLLFVVFDDSSWSPFQVREGVVLERFSNTRLFTEWFTPYHTKELNLFTAIFTITLLPAALVGAIKDFTSRK